jgi:uncharacterized coiled-coil protein SlyX
MTNTDSAKLGAVEKALTEPLPKSFAVQEKGIHELLDDLTEHIIQADRSLKIIRKRLEEFDRLQTRFYNGNAR